MNGLAKIMISAVAIVVAGSTAAILLAPPSPQERSVRRQLAAQRLLEELGREIWDYHREQGEFPPGDGMGTASLVKALQRPSSSGLPYMNFPEGMLTETGDLRNPVDPDKSILFYRNNRTGWAEGQKVHNGGNFDLWCASGDGTRDGLNNWSPAVSVP